MLKTAIVGLGWWGKTLVRAAKATGEIEIVAGATGRRANAEAYAAEQGFRLHDDLAGVLADPEVEAVLLATPHLDHDDHIVACAKAGKAIFVEKPFTMTKAGAERAIAAVEAAGVVIGLGHNRRFHPHMIELRRRLAAGELGTVLHVEGTMTAPNGLFLKAESWRSDPAQSPAGGMSGLGIHMVDGMIDLVGEVAEVTAQAIHRATPSGSKDTTSVLIRFRDEGGRPGPTGFVSCMTATAPTYRFCIYGSKGVAEIRGQGLDEFVFTPTPDAPLGGHATPKPAERSEVKGYDTVAAELAAFAAAVAGRAAFPITHGQMIHGAAVFEAIASSAAAGERIAVP
jgi:predicted dehydrogenase